MKKSVFIRFLAITLMLVLAFSTSGYALAQEISLDDNQIIIHEDDNEKSQSNAMSRIYAFESYPGSHCWTVAWDGVPANTMRSYWIVIDGFTYTRNAAGPNGSYIVQAISVSVGWY
ncbi:MAG: hypothetical protein GX254_00100 [Clostridiales bacterium]|jgi:hypothetical protein|nr:hypothetical protein [Clostridiales bacterium]